MSALKVNGENNVFYEGEDCILGLRILEKAYADYGFKSLL